MKKLLFIVLISFTITSCLKHTTTIQTGILAEVSPGSVGMSSERLTLLDSMLSQSIKANKIPGALALISRHGKIVYHKAFGMADNASEKALEEGAIFRIASQTKAITSTAVMMLWEEGKFDLDDPISKYI